MANFQILKVSLLAVVFVLCTYAVGVGILCKNAKKKSVFWYLLVNGFTTGGAAVLLLSPFYAPRGLPMLDYYIPFVLGAGACWFIGEVLLFIAIALSLKFQSARRNFC